MIDIDIDIDKTMALLAEDIQSASERSASLSGMVSQIVLHEEIYPMLTSFCAPIMQLHERLSELEDAFVSTLQQQESIILPDLADQLMGVIRGSQHIIDELTKLSGSIPDQLAGEMNSFALKMADAIEAINEHTIDLAEEAEGGDQ